MTAQPDRSRFVCLLAGILACSSILQATPTLVAGKWVFENGALRVSVNEKTANWDVLDKRVNQLWPQTTEQAREQWLVPIRQTAKPPVLDGKIDEWPSDGVFVGSKLATTTAATPTSTDGDQDSSARFHFAWDAAGWWLAADVTDDRLVAPPVGADLWHVDSIELWLGNEHWGLAPDGDQVRIACWSNPAMAKGCRAVAQPTKTGWQLEAFIPWSVIAALPKGPRAGAKMLLAVGLNDCDGGPRRQCQLFYPVGYKHKVMNTHALANLDKAGTVAPPHTRTLQPTHVLVKRITPLPGPAEGVQIELDYTEKGGTVLPLTSRIWLPLGQGDVACELSGDATLGIQEIALPAPFVLDAPKGVLVIPQGAGLLFRVDELSWHGGHLGGKMSMPWFGSADLASGRGYIGIMETPDDALFRGTKVAGTDRDVLAVQPILHPQKGKLGYARRFLYHFADQGGYVALAKRYRAYVKQDGRLKTLLEKRRERPNIDRLVGAVNIYSSHFGNLEELHRLGVERALISGHGAGRVRQMNEWGYLTGRYDIYSDLYEPGTPPSTWERCRGFHFPEDVIKKADGSKQVGWCPIPNAKTGKKDPSYVACWSCALRVLRERVPKCLATKPLTAYFLDCVTATRLYECYDPKHPLTRTTDREARIGQFRYLSDELKLVVGSEAGRDWAVPVADYFEGIMSTASFFANPKAIHEIPFVSIEPEPRYEEYDINPWRRVPLFQLVYGDCAEITWRWGDNTHRMPKLWAMKDLQHIIHASMPMFVLWDVHQDLFLANTERFMETYNNVCRWRRAVGYSEMTNHERLSEDAMVQRSSFANGATVTVNFAPEERMAGGVTLPSRSFLITGDAPELEGLPVGRPVQVSDPWEPKQLVLTGNTDFEKGPFLWRGMAGIELSVQSNVAQSGTHAAKISGTQDGGWSFARAPTVPVEAGQRYRMSCWLRVDAIAPSELAPNLKCELHKDGKYLVNIYTPAYDLSKLGTWQKLEKVFTVPAGAGSGALALEKRTTKSATATLYLDDVKLISLPVENP